MLNHRSPLTLPAPKPRFTVAWFDTEATLAVDVIWSAPPLVVMEENESPDEMKVAETGVALQVPVRFVPSAV